MGLLSFLQSSKSMSGRHIANQKPVKEKRRKGTVKCLRIRKKKIKTKLPQGSF